MKKILVSLVLVFALFFSFGNLQVNAELSKQSKQKIDSVLYNYFMKIREGNDDIKILEKLEKIYKKINYLLNKNEFQKYGDILKFMSDRIKREINYTGARIFSNYYSSISNTKQSKQNLEKAYKMKKNPKVSFNDFEQIYKTDRKNIYLVEDISYLGNSIFEIRVDLYDGDLDSKGETFKERYKVIMKIHNDGKLETLKVEKIKSEILEEKTFGKNKAVIKWKNGDKILYLNGKIIKKYTKVKNDFFGIDVNVWGLEFLADGKILKYNISGWEYGQTVFYNLENKKFLILDGLTDYGIEKNKKYLYVCGGSGLYPGQIAIYRLSDFSLYKDLSEGNLINKCIGYNKEKNFYEYELNTKDETIKKKYFFEN